MLVGEFKTAGFKLYNKGGNLKAKAENLKEMKII